MSTPRFSARTAFGRQPNRLAQLLQEARAAGRQLLDLTESNPTVCGFREPAALVAALGDPRGLRYEPSPLGLAAAREAVAGYYRRRGLRAEAGRIVLTASSSEAYSWLFKLLADPGDAVLGPVPSYPLLPYLAALEGVRLLPYPLIRRERWRVDVPAVARILGEHDARVRAIVLVSPNNPTGSLVRRDDALALGRLAAAAGAALVVDEVFADYGHGPPGEDRLPRFAPPQQPGALELPCERALCFVLGGLSKVALLPQFKLGWMCCYGPEPALAEALGRLELVADSFLSVSTAVQLAAPAVLAACDELQAEVHERLRRNLAAIDAAIAAAGPACPVRRLPSEGGWYAVIEVPRTRSDDEWIELLLRDEGLVVHPGYFFDTEGPGSMVVSLLLPPEVLADGIGRAVARWAAG
ncbi:MAG: pyridoxal phosphate-dependent aminotransferase [Deltaproteobacteria bacterium]|nr:pyridoxal phosphate-dependent aminotransferase [Deltaproteobacteria bacterium]